MIVVLQRNTSPDLNRYMLNLITTNGENKITINLGGTTTELNFCSKYFLSGHIQWLLKQELIVRKYFICSKSI